MDREQQVERYPITPLQEGLLFNSVSASEPGIDSIQVICRLREALQVATFQQAWQQMYERHTVLRTALLWDRDGKPIQEVVRHIHCPLYLEDWGHLNEQEQQERLETYLQEDRRRGFIFEEPPLMRLALFSFAETDYRFIMTFHHAILDGRSLPTLFKEAFETYEALKSASTLELPPPRPYSDYAIWYQGRDLTSDEAFWSKTLDGFSTPTSFPVEAGLRDSADPASSHQESNLRLSAVLTQDVRQYADRHQISLNMLCQGAWAFVLSRYSGQEDIVFGTVRSCRRGTIPEAEAMVGLFLNTLPVRVQLSGGATVLPWLKALHAQGQALRDHQFAALSQVQQWSQLPGGVPLFESVFIFEHRTLHSTLQAYGGPWCKRDFALLRKPSYPLAIYVFDEPEMLVTGIYDQRLFSRSMISHILNHFQDVLAAIVAGDEAIHLDDLPAVSEEERQLLLSTWNATQQDYPRNCCIHQLVEEQAARFPTAVAIQTASLSMTYEQLNAQANRLAHLLRSLGVGPNMCVAVCLPRSSETIVSQLGILKAGGAFLMLDPDFPQERLAFLIKDARIDVVLTQQTYAPRLLAGNKTRIIIPDAPVDFLQEWSPENPVNRTTSDSLAYIIYTSGSTGVPKGVQIQHRGLVNFAAWYSSTFHIQPEDHCTHLAALTFDASVLEIWPCLLAGASLHLLPDEIRIQPRVLIDWFVEHAITISFLPTPLGEAVLQQSWPTSAALRVLTIGGDQLMRSPDPGIPFKVYNLYGPTESSIVATWTLVEPASEEQIPSIGRPIANTKIYLLDQQLAPVPIGATGELFIGGDGLALGYLNRPDLTAACFIQDPFEQRPDARVYRSGDLARYRTDGSLEYIGRIDSQVKIRGIRIELREIESILLQHPG
ncbi:MAG TPA: amino acid adenylation domain-containing protein, partial [Ktedonobacteraceae bacterium]|nr:amino acid adenylation domain-containing protein [Ktedonobacteraceae bacterium]